MTNQQLASRYLETRHALAQCAEKVAAVLACQTGETP